jgi:hypothetical protein
MRQPAVLTGPEKPGGKVWTQYEGNMMGEFEVRGQVTGDRYRIYGKGYRFQIWAQDAQFFASLGRGKHFTVGVSPPAQAPPPPPTPEPESTEPEYQAPEPEMAVIERLDPIGASTRDIVEPPGGPIEPQKEPVQMPELGLVEEAPSEQQTPLDAMESLNEQQKGMLTMEGWHLEKLASADVEELVPYPSIGKVTAARAIAEANKLWES